MNRAPLVAFLALLGFIALVALGLGWVPRESFPAPSRPPAQVDLGGLDAGPVHVPVLSETTGVTSSAVPTPLDTLATTHLGEVLERAESSPVSVP